MKRRSKAAKSGSPANQDLSGSAAGKKGFPVWLELSLSAIAMGLTYGTLIGVLDIIGYPLDANAGEGVVWAETRWIADGRLPYRDPAYEPFWVGTYPPLVQWLGGAFGGVLSIIRLEALIGSLVCAGLASVMAERVARENGLSRGRVPEFTIGSLAGALWICSPFTAEWNVLARVDMPGRALASAAVVLACVGVAGGTRKRWAWLGGSVMAATLAMGAKQTMLSGGATAAAIIATAAAAAGASGIAEPRRAAWLRGSAYLAVWIAAVGFGVTMLSAATGGWFFRNVFRDTATRAYEPELLWQWTQGFAVNHPGLLVAAAIGAWRLTRPSPEAAESDVSGNPGGWVGLGARPWSRGLLLAAVAGTAMLALAANDGVDRNYFFDLLWPLVGLAAVSVAPTRNGATGNERLAPRVAVVAVMFQLGLQAFYGGVAGPTPSQFTAAKQFKRRLAAIPSAAGPILAEFPGHAIVSGRQPEYLPYMLARMEKAGRFDPAPVVAKLDRRAYAAVILSPRTASGRFSPAIMAAIERNYAVANPTRDLYKDMFCADGPCDLVWLSPNPKK